VKWLENLAPTVDRGEERRGEVDVAKSISSTVFIFRSIGTGVEIIVFEKDIQTPIRIQPSLKEL
jgi:hypothetical protein